MYIDSHHLVRKWLESTFNYLATDSLDHGNGPTTRPNSHFPVSTNHPFVRPESSLELRGAEAIEAGTAPRGRLGKRVSLLRGGDIDAAVVFFRYRGDVLPSATPGVERRDGLGSGISRASMFGTERDG